MILRKIQVINYKSCNNVFLDLEKDNPNILIGINDSGKSTILNAIGLLLSDKSKFNFVQDDKVKKDISNAPINEEEFNLAFKKFDVEPILFDEDSCYVIGEFEVEEHDITDNLSTHLQWVLDKEDVTKIHLCRHFQNSDKSSNYYILTPQGIDDPSEYYKEKATALNKVVKTKNIKKIENENNAGRFSTLELLRSIMLTLTLKPTWAQYKFDKDFFPEFRYLDWNISMDQLTEFTKDTMQAQIVTELSDARKFANDKRKLAQKKINSELDQFALDYLKDVPSIEKLKANIYFDVQPKVTDFVINKTGSVGDIHIDSQGDGVKRQIWFSLIKWKP